MPVFFTPWLLTRLALIASVETETVASVETVETVAPVETETAAPVETVAPVETETASVETETASEAATMDMTKEQLQELATARNIKFAKSWNKTKLVEAINA